MEIKFAKLNPEAERLYDRLMKSEARELRDVFASYSKEKHDAYEAIKARMARVDGSHLRIIGSNRHMFTCGWLFDIIDPETGEVLHMVMVIERKSGTTYYDIQPLYHRRWREKRGDVD